MSWKNRKAIYKAKKSESNTEIECSKMVSWSWLAQWL